MAGALVLAGCYAPSVRDCTVTCASPGECAGGQICGADGLCAAPQVAGRCRMLAPDARARDDAPPPSDAGAPRDAAGDASPDAADLDAGATVVLHVQITGKGSVVVDGSGVCSSKGPRRGSCLYDVAAGVPVTVHAVEIKPDEVFAMWTSATCAGEGARCVFTPVAATSITARFVHD